MYKFLTKNGQAAAFGLGLIIVLIFYFVVGSGLDEFNAVAEKERPMSPEGNIFLFGLQASTWLIIGCLIAIVLFGIFQVISNPKGALKGIIGIGVLAVIFFALYSGFTIDNNAGIMDSMSKFNISSGSGVDKYINASLATAVGLGVFAFITFIIAEIINLFK